MVLLVGAGLFVMKVRDLTYRSGLIHFRCEVYRCDDRPLCGGGVQPGGHVIVPFTAIVARCSAAVVRGLGGGAEAAGTVIRSPRFAIDVQNGCNGIEAAILLAAAIFAFPATLRSRLIGLLAATVAIELLNLVRLSSLVWLGEHYRPIFDFVHVAVWQSLVILAAISLFVLWSWKFA
jgi:exosortase H (IPTLxxWG-CTERM-specific)